MKQSDYQTEWLYHKATKKVCDGAGKLNKQQVYFLDISFWLQKMSKKKVYYDHQIIFLFKSSFSQQANN